MTPVIPAKLPEPPPHRAAPHAAPRTATTQPRHAAPGRDGAGIWLHAAAAGLLALSGAAAVVSFSAQYRLVYQARHLPVPAGLEAAIPDAAALVFACLGVALALHGRQAVRARLLNMASALASVFMNVIAAAPGWRDAAVWAMPPAAYALASDTLIGVVRAQALARHPGPAALAGEVTLLAAAGGLALWLLRLAMDPRSTLAGFRDWVLESPVAPGRRPGRPVAAPVVSARRMAVPAPRAPRRQSAARDGRGSGPQGGTKTARFLALVAQEHGPLISIPLGSVGPISTQVAPQAGLNAGSARAALRRAVLAAQNGGQS